MAIDDRFGIFACLDGDAILDALPTLEKHPIVRDLLMDLSTVTAFLEAAAGAEDIVRGLAACKKLAGPAQYARFFSLMDRADARGVMLAERKAATIVVEVAPAHTPVNRFKRRYDRNKAAGTCVCCGREPAVPGRAHGPDCLARKRRQKAERASRLPRPMPTDREQREVGRLAMDVLMGAAGLRPEAKARKR